MWQLMLYNMSVDQGACQLPGSLSPNGISVSVLQNTTRPHGHLWRRTPPCGHCPNDVQRLSDYQRGRLGDFVVSLYRLTH